MDEQLHNVADAEQAVPAYKPRPAWQVWLARIGVVLALVLTALYYLNIAQGGT